MPSTPERNAQRLTTILTLSAENVWALVRYAMRKHWYLIAVATTIGFVLALFNARSAPNEFEVTASILVPTEEYIIEFDRLHSRSLASKVAEDFKLQRSIHDAKYGWIEMYNESPFELVLIQFPQHLQDQDHSLRILPNRQVRVAIDAGQDSIILQGPAGSVLSANGVKLQVTLTNFYNTRHLNAKFQFRWMSLKEATRDFVSRLQVTHYVEHPNIYRFFFTDLHPQLALDKMTAFLNTYLDAYRQHRYLPLLQRLQQVDAKIAVYERQILNLGQYILPSGFSTFGFERITIEQDLRLAQLRNRIQQHLTSIMAMKGFIGGNRSWKETVAASPVLQSSHLMDSIPPAGVLDSLLRSMQDSLQQMEASLLTENRTFISAHNVRTFWEGSWLSSREDTVNFSYLLRREYESALIERSEIELSSRNEMRMITVSDPPYLVRSIGRSSRMRLFLALVLGGFMIGFTLAVFAAAAVPRIQSLAQLRMALGDDAPWLEMPANPERRRQTLTDIAMAVKGEKPLVVVFGSAPAASDLAEMLYQQELAHERSAAKCDTLVTSEVPTALGTATPPAPAWWLSQRAQTALDMVMASHELLILALPDPSSVPEMVGVLVRATHVYVAIKGNTVSRSSLKKWLAIAQKYDAKPTLIWMNA